MNGPGDRPDGWGRDPLTDFLERAFRNRLASFANHPMAQKAIAIDATYMDFFVDWTNPGHALTPHFLIRCHSAFRAAVEHAFAGQVAEVAPLARAALEYAGYAVQIDRNDVGEIWLRRHESEDAFQKCVSAFRQQKVVRTIREIDEPTADRFERLYQWAVDTGAHPNEQAITGSLRMERQSGGILFEQTQLHGEGVQLDNALMTACRVGMLCLEIFAALFVERFERLGLIARFPVLRKGL